MPVYGVDYTTAGGVSPAITDTANGTLGKDDFLQLLVAQLQAQNPLKPMDSTEFTAQLAQFSSLEQLQNIDANLSNLKTEQSAMNNTMAVEFVGKNVTASGNTLSLTDGYSDDIHFELHSDAVTTHVNIYDQSGSLVKSIEAGNMTAGMHDLTWNGVDNRGSRASDGVYSYEVLAVDAFDQMVSTSTFISGIVTAVSFRGDSPILMTGEREIPFENVIEVNQPIEINEGEDTAEEGSEGLSVFSNISKRVSRLFTEPK